ncbi:pimeloyl-ACP methyl ester carboxylesterase [Rhodoferax antarcticus]|nr:hypothetical protein RA876_15410 [Rhodoferax antarcticus]MCW2311824.1 pimeloyl-ACP methyl ester carboxylesterase [Rhodoferax antarcticus]
MGLLLALSACAWLTDQQRLIIYRPTTSQAPDLATLPANTKLYFVDRAPPAAPARLALWWLAHPDPAAPTLLYLHGTFRALPGNQAKIEALRAAGFSVLAVDYRGWGQSTSIVPSEDSIQQDARRAWAELVRREPRPAMRVIYGHSMGSGVAATLASHLSSPLDYGALILESAFTSFADIAAEAGFWASLAARFSPERFASIEKIERVNAPVLMLHGVEDRNVPMVLGQRLFAAANPPKQWVQFAGAHHSDLQSIAPASYQATLTSFRQRYLDKCAVTAPVTPAPPQAAAPTQNARRASLAPGRRARCF